MGPRKYAASRPDLRLVVQHDIQQRTMNFDMAVVIDETELSKSVHEEANARSGRADHLRQRFLADFRDDRLCFPFLAKIRQQQKKARQAFLTRIEQLIDKVRFHADGPRQQDGVFQADRASKGRQIYITVM